MFAKIFFFFFSSVLFAQEISLETRTRFQLSNPDSLEQGIGYQKMLLPWLDFEGKFRIAESRLGLDSVRYALQWKISPLSWIHWNNRMHQWVLPASSISGTEFLTSLELDGFWWNFIGADASFGISPRRVNLQGMSFFPFFNHTSLSETEWAAHVGFSLQWAESFRSRFIFSTLEDIEIYRLNYPFFQLSTTYTPSEASWSAQCFIRSHRLLGFGRSDGWVVGFKVNFLNPFSSEDTKLVSLAP